MAIKRLLALTVILAGLSLRFHPFRNARTMKAKSASVAADKIRHFVYIIQENESFDRYFGTYPGVDGIPQGVKLAYRPGGTPEVAPFHLHETTLPHDLSHSWQAAHIAYDDGKMDGFLWAERRKITAYPLRRMWRSRRGQSQPVQLCKACLLPPARPPGMRSLRLIFRIRR